MSIPSEAGRLQELLADRDNNFDVLRLAAAVMVLVGHAFFLVGEPGPVVPLTDAGLASSGVLLFFAISGFLVTRSWLNEPRVLSFAVKRGLRIMPGLVVVLVLTAYVVGPLTTSTGRLDYLSQSAPAEYVLGHSLMLNDHVVHERLTRRFGEAPDALLPGVFDRNPEQYVNGSLWTLPVEVTAYTLLALGGLLILFWRQWSTRIIAAIVLSGATALALLAGGELTYPLFAVFAGGSLLYALRDRLKLSVGLFAAAVGLWILSYQLPLVAQAVVTGLTLPYVVVFLAFRGIDRLRWLTRPGDVSYGLYIYAWPVQQLVVHATGTRNPALVIALSAVMTYLLAFASWRAVERPALRLKRRLSHPSVRRTAVGSKADLAPAGASSRGLT